MNQSSSNSSSKLSIFQSIQGQLILWFLVLGLVPLIVMSLLTWLSSSRALETSIGESLQAVADAKATRVTDWMADSIRISDALANLPGIRGDSNPETTIGLGDISRYKNRTFA